MPMFSSPLREVFPWQHCLSARTAESGRLMESYDIIILTDARYEKPDEANWYVAQLLGEERLLLAGLEARGLRTARVAWSNPDFDWSRTRAAVFRSTWDYFERFAEFSAWMDRVERGTRLFNAPELVRWNVDKHYLRNLAGRGVNVPVTRFLERGEMTTLREAFADCGWSEAILKPAVSGAARHTYRLNAAIGIGNLRACRTFTFTVQADRHLDSKVEPKPLECSLLNCLSDATAFSAATR